MPALVELPGKPLGARCRISETARYLGARRDWCAAGWSNHSGGSAALSTRSPLFPFVAPAPVWTVVDGAISGAAVAACSPHLRRRSPRRVLYTPRHSCRNSEASITDQTAGPRRQRRSALSSEHSVRQTSGNKSPPNRPGTQQLILRPCLPTPLCVLVSKPVCEDCMALVYVGYSGRPRQTEARCRL